MTYRMWCMILLEYDDNGNATVVKSFNKPAKESTAKQGVFAKKTVEKPKQVFKKFEVTNADKVESADIL